MTPLVKSQALLFGFFLRDGWKLFGAVASAWDRQHRYPSQRGGLVTRLTFPRALVDGYNQRYEALKHDVRRMVPARGLFGSSYIAPLFIIRIACVVTAATTGFLATFLFSLLQFVVAPFSFFAAFAAWLGVVPFYVIHFTFFAGLQLATGLIYARAPWAAGYLHVPITTTVIVAWVVIDQALCLVLCYWTPVGRPVRVPLPRPLQSVGYGFLNCKTYWLVLLLSLRGMPIDLLALGIHACIPQRYMMAGARRVLKVVIPARMLHWTFPSAMFYHYHRTVHLPGAYVQAHRHHHYLHDSTPFDADMHGSGMPEEWFKLMTEIAVCLATGLMPWSFTLPTIKQSLSNRVGHTRLEGGRTRCTRRSDGDHYILEIGPVE